MSAFIVNDEIINRIVTHIAQDQYLRRELEELHALDLNAPGRFAQAMYDLNREAVRQRYRGEDTAQFRPFVYRPEIALPVQVLKSLRCWLYQCGEGNVPETALYKHMDYLSGRIALRIVQASKAYDAAEW